MSKYELTYVLKDDNTYKVTGVTASAEADSIEIPLEYNGVAVTEIATEAFKDLTNLTNITIPNSIQTIGTSILVGCSSLAVIQFEGKRAEWDNVSKTGWDLGVGPAVKKYLIAKNELPSNSTIVKTIKQEDIISKYAIKDIKGNQIDTTYIPRTEYANLINIANGLCKTYVATIEDNPQFNSSEDTISITQFTLTTGATILASQLYTGDAILLTNVGKPDRWVIRKEIIDDEVYAVLGTLETNNIVSIKAVEKDNSASDDMTSVYNIRLTDNSVIKGFSVTNGANGADGAPGAAAGFGTPTATVTTSTGTPTVSVSASGPDTAKVFNFAFSGLKGEKGDPGQTITYNASSKILTIKG